MVDNRLAALVEEIVRLAPTLDPIVVSTIVDNNVRNVVSAEQLRDHWAQHPDVWISGDGAPPVVQRIATALHEAGAVHIVKPRCGHCRRVRPLRYVHDGTRVCGACRARLSATACASCGLVKPVAVTTPDGPVCARCRLNDPDTWEPCIVCSATFAVGARDASGAAICRRCYRAPKRICDGCGNEREIRSKRTGRSLCDGCCTQLPAMRQLRASRSHSPPRDR